MCLAAMRMAGIIRVRYALSNEDAEPYGLSTAAVYADLARPFEEQSMDIRHARTDAGSDLYAMWKALQTRSPDAAGAAAAAPAKRP